MDYAHCPKCRNAYNVAAGCSTCVVATAAPIALATSAEGSGPVAVARVPNRFRMAANANRPYATPVMRPSVAPTTAIIAADPIADVVAAASLLVRVAARITPRQMLGAVLSLVTRAPRFLRS
ncbi:hypothetical protein BH11MYX2_BH11MYX2_33610 [soil metagenome]